MMELKIVIKLYLSFGIPFNVNLLYNSIKTNFLLRNCRKLHYFISYMFSEGKPGSWNVRHI